MRICIIFIISCSLSLAVNASHMYGGEISYRYVGPGSSANSEQYEVLLILYADGGTSGNICVNSSCVANPISATLSLQPNPAGTIAGPNGGYYLRNYDSCSTPYQAGNLGIRAFEYKGLVTLPVKCNDWTFTWHGCCRDFAVSNLNTSGSTKYDFTAELNNMSGPNSSAKNLSPLFRSFCLGSLAYLPKTYIESDGDSVTYELSNVFTNHSSTGNTCTSRTALSFLNGFSALQPLPTSSPFITSSNSITFYPAQIGSYAIGIKMSEHRFDPNISQWVKIGSSFVDHIINVKVTCDSSSMRNANFQDTINVPCGDSTAILTANRKILGSSVASDGSDFRCISPSITAYPVIKAEALVNPAGQANSITVSFLKPFNKNGVYALYLKTGNDGNVLITDCGFEDQDDTIYLKVEGCSSIGIEEEDYQFSVYPNPTDGVLKITHEQDIAVSVKSVNGQLIKHTELMGNIQEINISDLLSGLYFLEINARKSGKLLGTTKIIKQ